MAPIIQEIVAANAAKLNRIRFIALPPIVCRGN